MTPALYPPIQPHQSGRLQVDGGHTLYWESSGDPRGKPVLFLHGGPGEGCHPNHRRFFDPAHYRIILFDQRGAGRATPLGETRDNTPAHLVADIERLRTTLGVERWLVFGGSWGSALAVLYAQAHRARCAGLILRGVSLFEREDQDWWFYGMGRFFPELWERFAALAPEDERQALPRAYQRLLESSREETRLAALAAIHAYACGCGGADPAPPEPDLTDQGIVQPLWAFYRLFLHYARHHWLEKDRLLRGLEGLPGIIVQGRYDMVCPPVSAYRLHRAWPGSRLHVLPGGGHASFEPAMAQALRKAADLFRS